MTRSSCVIFEILLRVVHIFFLLWTSIRRQHLLVEGSFFLGFCMVLPVFFPFSVFTSFPSSFNSTCYYRVQRTQYRYFSRGWVTCNCRALARTWFSSFWGTWYYFLWVLIVTFVCSYSNFGCGLQKEHGILNGFIMKNIRKKENACWWSNLWVANFLSFLQILGFNLHGHVWAAVRRTSGLGTCSTTVEPWLELAICTSCFYQSILSYSSFCSPINGKHK